MIESLDEFTYGYYRKSIDEALRVGYQFETFSALPLHEPIGNPVCLLRHDCDNDLDKAVDLARIEMEMGVRATYFVMTRSAMYNPFAKTSMVAVREISQLGHEIGLHFDEELVANCTEVELQDFIDADQALIKQHIGVDAHAVSFHRPGKRILENLVKIRQINTYSKTDMATFQYISDSSHIMRVDLPLAFRTTAFPRLHLNLHPEWWSAMPGTVNDRWQEILACGLYSRQRELWEREDAFLTKFTVKFSPDGETRELPNHRIYQRYEVG